MKVGHAHRGGVLKMYAPGCMMATMPEMEIPSNAPVARGPSGSSQERALVTSIKLEGALGLGDAPDGSEGKPPLWKIP